MYRKPLTHQKGSSIRVKVPSSITPQSRRLSASTPLLLVLLTAGLLAGGYTVGSTCAFFSDSEKTTANVFIADPLAFSLAPQNGKIDLGAGEQQFTVAVTPDEQSDPLQYYIRATQTGGDDALCQAVRVYSTAPNVFDGQLLSLISPTSTQMGSWTLHFYLSGAPEDFDNASCTADITFIGSNASALLGQGFTDKHSLSLTFFVPHKAAPAPLVAKPEGDENTAEENASTTQATTTPEALDNQSEEATTTDATTSPTGEEIETNTATTSEAL